MSWDETLLTALTKFQEMRDIVSTSYEESERRYQERRNAEQNIRDLVEKAKREGQRR